MAKDVRCTKWNHNLLCDKLRYKNRQIHLTVVGSTKAFDDFSFYRPSNEIYKCNQMKCVSISFETLEKLLGEWKEKNKQIKSSYHNYYKRNNITVFCFVRLTDQCIIMKWVRFGKSLKNNAFRWLNIKIYFGTIL